MTSQAVLVRSPLLLLSSPKLRPAFQKPQALPRLRLNSSRNPTLVLASTASSSSISSSSSLPTLPPRTPKITSQSPITQTFATVAGIALFFARVIQKLSPKITEQVWLQSNLVGTVGPLFFAALNDRPRGYLNTPLTVVAAGLAKWLDIYSGVLMVRVLLSWFPNIPWDRQPLSAIRDLCDPFLNLFRNIIPPIFDTLDVSPLLAFAVLGVLGSILNSSKVVF